MHEFQYFYTDNKLAKSLNKTVRRLKRPWEKINRIVFASPYRWFCSERVWVWLYEWPIWKLFLILSEHNLHGPMWKVRGRLHFRTDTFLYQIDFSGNLTAIQNTNLIETSYFPWFGVSATLAFNCLFTVPFHLDSSWFPRSHHPGILIQISNHRIIHLFCRDFWYSWIFKVWKYRK